jgi:hypothetical protein
VLADAEAIVEHEEPVALRELVEADAQASRRHWWSRRKRLSPDGEEFGPTQRA